MIAVFRERVLNIANDEISRRYKHMFDLRHRQPVLLTFAAVAVVPIKRRNLQFHFDSLTNIMANVNTFVNVNWTTNVTGCAASLTANPRLAGLRARNFRLRFAKSRLASLGLLLQPHPDPTPWIGDETDALAFERLLDVRGGGTVGHWSGGDVRPRRSKIQPVVRRSFVFWTKGSRRDVCRGGLRGGSAICFQ